MAVLNLENKVLFDVESLSKKTGLSIQTLRSYIREKKLAAVKVGRKYWIAESEVTALFTGEKKK